MLKSVIEALIEHGDLDLSEKFLNSFPIDYRQTSEFLRAEFLLLNESAALDKILTHGRKLIKNGIKDPKIYEILIHRALQAKLKRAAENLAYEAASFWPQEKGKFLKLIEEP